MEVREAVEADAERMAALADSPPDVMRNLVHDRTVRVALEAANESGEAGESGTADDEGSEDADRIAGFVSFDARDSTVHITQLAGTETACARLLEEPIGFARREGMTVELLLPEDDEAVEAAVESAGFEAAGSGPRFEGRPTTRYRLRPERARR